MTDLKSDDILLVFGIDEDENDPDSKIITCEVPYVMIKKWIKCTPALNMEMEDYTYRLIKVLKTEDEEVLEDDAAIDSLSEKHGFDVELQSLLMRAVIDLKVTLGTEDFFDLYKVDGDFKSDFQFSEQTALNDDGSVQVINESSPDKLD